MNQDAPNPHTSYNAQEGPAFLRAARARIAQHYRLPEAEALAPLLDRATLHDPEYSRAQALAQTLVDGLREQRRTAGGIDALMQEFPLSAPEGVALMCLAETLLRVPDADNVTRLLRDKLAHIDWRGHLGHSPSLFVNAATWGLMLTGELLTPTQHAGLGDSLSQLLARGGEPLIRKGMDHAVRLLGRQFVAGEDMDQAWYNTRKTAEQGFMHSFDMLGEAALTDADAQHFVGVYEQAIQHIGNMQRVGLTPITRDGVSIKLSALHPRYTHTQSGRVFDELYPRLLHLAQLARSHNLGLNIDAEECDRLELSLDLLERLTRESSLRDWHGLGFVVQAYQKRAMAVVDWLAQLARMSDHRLMVRLVKGAYWDSEIKWAQQRGDAEYPVWTRKTHTDVSYLACARQLLDARDLLYPQFATHNALTTAQVVEMAGSWRVGDFEFQCLHGMGEALYSQLLNGTLANNEVTASNTASDLPQRPCRIYAPVGNHAELLGYLVRRLLENGANTSFVHRLVNPDISDDVLLADPAQEVQRHGLAPHPRIGTPLQLFADRPNSLGTDLALPESRNTLRDALSHWRLKPHTATPLIADPHNFATAARAVANPARVSDIVGTVQDASRDTVNLAFERALTHGRQWSNTGSGRRAKVLDDAADVLEVERDVLAALIVREAGRTPQNAYAEVREAIDFCRYYAAQLRGWPGLNDRHGTPLNDIPGEALGPVVCISPWNFPLAIFVGQIAAALAAGNPVLAKPAEQTTLTAHYATQMLHDAGVPAAALQLLPGMGERTGQWLVNDTRAQGVLFTGSTQVAQRIAQQLAKRADDVPLIAETGGQNAMIVDSTALPEQAILDILQSAFDSSGQRCSSLRVLCVQNEIADTLLPRLYGALAEWRIGDPTDLSTDIGPLIDHAALDAVQRHIQSASEQGRVLYQLPVPPQWARQGYYIAPTIIRLNKLEDLQQEVFGPVLHVIRFARHELGQIMEGLQATGYGLTLGVHSRIDETINFVHERARVGNLYVNRNQIGAVVGVQPFGGEGLSGTGPKCGGPLMLARLRRGQVLAVPARIPPELPVFDRFLEWLETNMPAAASTGLLARIAQFRAQSLNGRSMMLNGPIGESNWLEFHPRGNVWLIAASELERCAQLGCALATGNRVLMTDSESTRAFVQALPSDVRGRIDLATDPMSAHPAAILFDGAPKDSQALREMLASNPSVAQPLIPMLHRSPDYDTTRLITERCLCINTAASGGNAKLMGELE